MREVFLVSNEDTATRHGWIIPGALMCVMVATMIMPTLSQAGVVQGQEVRAIPSAKEKLNQWLFDAGHDREFSAFIRLNDDGVITDAEFLQFGNERDPATGKMDMTLTFNSQEYESMKSRGYSLIHSHPRASGFSPDASCAPSVVDEAALSSLNESRIFILCNDFRVRAFPVEEAGA